MKCTTQPWNIGKLWLQKNRINLDPPYQRESGVWSIEKKQLFIDSVLNGFDVPKLYFHDIEAKKEPFGFAVIDGKQRLGAIWDFLDPSGFSLASDFTFTGDGTFFVDGPAPQKGTKYSEFTPAQQEYFKSQTIDVVEVEGADEEDIEELFSRLNNGEPLNAAEKRNANSGDMANLVRDIAKDPNFTELMKFSDKRMSYHEVAAKLLRLELSHMEGQGIFADLKKKFLDALVIKNKSMPTSQATGLRSRVSKNIKELGKVFGAKSPLMNKQSFPQLYYGWVKQITSEYSHPALHTKIREFLQQFHADRIVNLDLPEDERDPQLIEFGRLTQQGTNDLQSMMERSKILTRYFLREVPDVAIKDSKRSFTEDERYVIWQRSGRMCQAPDCGTELPEIELMHADHVTAWANGGVTKLENAQALCEPCNLKKSAS
jgi:hypothetical protein